MRKDHVKNVAIFSVASAKKLYTAALNMETSLLVFSLLNFCFQYFFLQFGAELCAVTMVMTQHSCQAKHQV